MSWSEWDQEIRKHLYERMGDSVVNLYGDVPTKDHFHDMYQRGLTPLDAVRQYILNGVPKTNNGYRIA